MFADSEFLFCVLIFDAAGSFRCWMASFVVFNQLPDFGWEVFVKHQAGHFGHVNEGGGEEGAEWLLAAGKEVLKITRAKGVATK